MPANRRNRASSGHAIERRGFALVDLFGAGTSAEAPAKEFRIFGKGINPSLKGEVLFDDEAAQLVMAAAREHGVDFTVDYDHHTLHTDKGIKAVSAGWFQLDVRDGELWATDVHWNPPALEHFAKKEYRYFSPLFDFDRKTGRVVSLINTALTNTPALHGIDALVAASVLEDDDMTLEEALKRINALETDNKRLQQEASAAKGQGTLMALSATVGLASGAGDEEVRAVVSGLVSFRKNILALAGKDNEATALGALTAMKEQAGETVALRAKVEAAEGAALKTEFDGVLAAAIKDRKIPPATEHARHAFALKVSGAASGKITREGIDALKGYVDTLGPLVGGSDDVKEQPGRLALSGVQADVLKHMGIDKEAFRKREEAKLAAGG